MPYFHVHITTKSGNQSPEVELDLSSDELQSRFLEPYRLGRPMVVAGKSVTTSSLERIQIFETPHDSNAVNAEILARDRAGTRNVIRAVDTHGRLDPLILSQHGTDVTKNYIKGPPGYTARTQSEPIRELRPATNTREVFVVHGRNLKARDALFDFLRAIDLHPLEWSEAVAATGKASPYIGEILDAVFSHAHAVVVLLTPDDQARLVRALQSESDPPHETQLTGQARPNVLFETGMAMAGNQDRTILVELGVLRPFSDVGGRHVIRLDNSSQRRQELAQRLRDAGCPVNLDGIDWHTAGDFEAAISFSNEETTSPEADETIGSPTDQESHLSEDVRELLLESAQDSNTLIRVRPIGNHTFIHTNGRHFVNEGDLRSSARWKAVIEEIQKLGLVESSTTTRGTNCILTDKGFRLVDQLRNQG